MLGLVASYRLKLTWGSVCWDMFAIYSFAKQWVPTGTRANHVAVASFLFLSGGFFKSIFFLGDENVFEKIGPEWISSNSPTYLV